ncbi:hypothetical protein [Agromyces sp. Leaf222]|uniref:hypothetical protein n=1 Tax=Agromyces sp. Leaf222 TaxID=1735688 RepID=UPI0006F5E79D|nr:hypothetical protein [Agromyces sp. Leaf222]KQM83136.1 hypothetical protein ASE68_07730 [Agromyces sp. Leaf222]
MSIHDDHENDAAHGPGAVPSRARRSEQSGAPHAQPERFERHGRAVQHERRRAVTREVLGWAFALAMALLVTAHIAITRHELMFVDADSMLNALLAHSFASGAPQDWAMSPVLFVPEAIAFAAVSAVVPDLRMAFIMSSVLNFVALYGAFRVASGSRRTATAPVLGAVAAYAGFCAIALLESGGDRNSLQLASLLGTTTYYSATVVASVLVIGLVRRALDAGRLHARVWAPLAGMVAVSAFSNPLIVVWAVAPAALVLLVLMSANTGANTGASTTTSSRGRMTRRPSPPLVLVLVLAGASAVGLVARSAVGDLIVAQGADYVKDGNQLTALTDLLRAAAVELGRPGGVIAAILLLGLTVLAVTLTFSRTAADRPGTAVLVAVAWIAPVACTIGVIVLGNPSPRYLQPWVFAPVLVLACLAEWLVPRRRQQPTGGGDRRGRRESVLALAAASVVIVGLAGVGIVRLATAPSTASTTSLACVADWVNATDRHGAGQFWTVRAPKAYADDPARLLQVTDDLHPYAWLVNRTDFATRSVSFLVTDAQSTPFDLPGELRLADAATIDCGRYTIHDFGPIEIPVF